ncbi:MULTISPECIES: hypothetical protein [unclassified Pseudoalteromonas]|uniref:hypothetical protein n=1 Tax=unclassified Pseudoalteromonas TaxID=194690 RepID=UPI0023598E8A|nr:MULTISPECIES: hypothetical protein [unclassified Pseudoalteromonas]MDC9563918.1 hypothetical protein [Pseudoalteromonas sp. GAB2316C]MDC9568280.1 hypothetical protein [Pseudoalteromonas sp. GABNB9D]MDC9572720.1 hypothetical protein [Pseudoalteromonas sp. GABNS16A]MDC9576870.1 hypothetical protein [Pseudoalteromonas sp. GABNS16E]MDC9584266.1 hypothetical protein [Pseudoalteromonas sp. GABNS16C]
MKGGNGKKAATQTNLAANDNSPKKPKAQSKKERAFIYILQHPSGATENDILRNVGLSSGRNYFTQLERLHGFELTRVNDENPDGIGTHLRYSFSSPKIAAAILKEINASLIRRKAAVLSKEQEAELLAPFNRLP